MGQRYRLRLNSAQSRVPCAFILELSLHAPRMDQKTHGSVKLSCPASRGGRRRCPGAGPGR
ncbi:hypothetical protein RV420_400462 [Roseovarius sp. EC-SD190]|nr:hypothetical protein RV420_400462 [Roseovarius sp. EC-SD190]